MDIGDRLIAQSFIRVRVCELGEKDLKFAYKYMKEALISDKEPASEVPCSAGLWQPLETAPRDGTLVDLWHKNGFRVTEVWWADDVWSCVMDDDSFTHWMPIAAAP